MSVPNYITLLRIVLVPVVIWLILTGEVRLAFWLFLLAGLCDALDGWIARRFNMQTPLGAHLDPIADKLLLVGVFVTLGVVDALPLWLVVLVVSRDVMIVIAFAVVYLMGRPIQVRPLMVSKVNTAAQITLICGELARLAFSINLLDDIRPAAIIMVAALTILSWLVYFAVCKRHLSGSSATTSDRAGPMIRR